MRHRIVVRQADRNVKLEIEFDSSLACLSRELQAREIEETAFRASERVKAALTEPRVSNIPASDPWPLDRNAPVIARGS